MNGHPRAKEFHAAITSYYGGSIDAQSRYDVETAVDAHVAAGMPVPDELIALLVAHHRDELPPGWAAAAGRSPFGVRYMVYKRKGVIPLRAEFVLADND